MQLYMTIKVLKFEAEWCVPCKQQNKIIDSVKETFEKEDVTFESVDVDDEPDKSTNYGVKSVPTIIIKSEDSRKEFVGLTNQEELEDTIKEFLN